MSLAEWWIDGDLGMDAAGNLYATWDTQGTSAAGSPNDVGWLSFSTDHGSHWSPPLQAPPDRLNVPHIMEVTGAGSGVAYVGWLSNSDPRGYAAYLRAFSITRGWLSEPLQVSTQFGDSSVWPGDTFGISTPSTQPPRHQLGQRHPNKREEVGRLWGQCDGAVPLTGGPAQGRFGEEERGRITVLDAHWEVPLDSLPG